MSAWGQLKAEFGWRAARIAVRTGDAITAGAQVLYRQLPLGWTFAYVPKGPLVDLRGAQTSQCLFEGLHQQARSRRAIALKIEPAAFDPESVLDTSQTLVDSYRFQPDGRSVQPRRTILVDTRLPEDEMLRRMKSKTRYNIRLAERRGVRVHRGNQEDLGAFTRLMAVTGERNAFAVHSAAYYERVHALLAPAGLAGLFIATYEDRPIGGVMATTCGRGAWNMFSASGNEHREVMPNYALQWSVIRWARERGCATYDLWGVPDQDEETLEAQFKERRDGLWGLYRFKRGFGGQVVRYAGAFDYVYNGPIYKLYQLALKLR
jgi:lipid II:glycine glycyltransferase (peptidoglycan interpeptide bridge formation enzyme)